MFWYIVLTIVLLGNIFMFTHYANAQTIFCDKEMFIYFINNDLDGLIGCVNAPDVQQDYRLMELEEKVIRLENNTRTQTINGNTTNDK